MARYTFLSTNAPLSKMDRSSEHVHILKRCLQPGSPHQLALLRITIGLQVAYAVNSSIFDLLLATGGVHVKLSSIFPAWFDGLTRDLVPVLRPLCTVLGLMMAIGLLTRFVLPLLSVAFIMLYGFYYLGGDAPIQWLYFWFPLVVLCFARSEHVWSIDAWLYARRAGGNTWPLADLRQYRWPIEFMTGWFCYIYFAAGLAKVLPINKGLLWLNGQTSKEIIYYRYLDSPFHYLLGTPFFNYAKAYWPFVALTMGAVVLELATVLLLFTRRWNLHLLAAILMMHLFLYMTGVAGFMQTAAILGIALLPPEWFSRYTGTALHDAVSR